MTTDAYQPLVAILPRHPDIKLTLNIPGALTEQLLALRLDRIISGIAGLVERGQIELVGSPMYHPILPLIPRSERLRQFSLQTKLHQRAFGIKQPQGCYLPEMAFDPILEQDILSMGFTWTLLDEGSAGKGFNSLSLEQPYQTPSGLKVIFRNRLISDWMSFRADPDHPELARAAIDHDIRSKNFLVTGLDGENLGHHRHRADQLWEALVTGPGIETDTLSSFAALPTKPIQPLAGSWSSLPTELAAHIPYGLCNHPRNPLHQAPSALPNDDISTMQASHQEPDHTPSRRRTDSAFP